MNIKTKCKIKQKLMGLSAIAVAILSVVLTIAIFLVPLGLYMVFAKECFEYDELDEELEELEEEGFY